MKNLIRLEEAALWALSLWMYDYLGGSWAWYPLLLLLPDLSMAGYLAGPKTGAALYNFWHHRTVALLVFVLGYGSDHQGIMIAGVVLFGHVAMDRLFGYGLKYATGFQDTHLGKIGKQA